MRRFHNLLVLSGAATLAACGGDTSPQTVGSVAPPAGTPAPTHSFVSPTESKTYEGLGTVQHYEYYTDSNKNGQGGQLYAGDANTVRNSGISLTYNPRDAIFELTIERPLGLVSVAPLRYQDPMHRTAFGGPIQPQAGVPNFATLNGIQYLESGSGTGGTIDPTSPYYPRSAQSNYSVMADQSTVTRQTFFYQKPGTTTKYVTYAGFVRNTISGAVQQPDPTAPAFLRETYSFDRAAFVFGERTANTAVPKTGTGTFDGDMIATMVVNVDPTSKLDATGPSYLQWIEGKQHTDVDFAKLTVNTQFNGTVLAPALDAYTSGATPVAAGTPFNAIAHATIDMVNRGGFTGQFSVACFATACSTNGVDPLLDNRLLIAGSSFDGTFYGPNGEEIGGGFRIVGGRPDQRIDILGAFTGKKP